MSEPFWEPLAAAGSAGALTLSGSVAAANTDLANPGAGAAVVTYRVDTGGGSIRSLGASTTPGQRFEIQLYLGTSAVTLRHNVAGGSGLPLFMEGQADIILLPGYTAHFTNLNTLWLLTGITRSGSPGMTTEQAFSVRANRQLMGPAAVNYVNSRIKWAGRFIVISQGVSPTTSAGYFDITMPPVGTVVPGVGGRADDTVTADGIAFQGWDALYYILPLGSGASTVNTNFRRATYSAGLVIPPEWVLLALYNADVSHIWLAPGAPRIVSGYVNANGAIAGGSGFSVGKQGTGLYTVHFSPAFVSTPAFVFTLVYPGAGSFRAPFIRSDYGLTGANATVATQDGNGSQLDVSFMFHAIGM